MNYTSITILRMTKLFFLELYHRWQCHVDNELSVDF